MVPMAQAPDEFPVDLEPSNVTELIPVTRRERPRGRRPERVRMSGQERREQLLDVGRKLFAEKGFEAVSVEEIAQRAGVSKPVVYEHFGGKEGLYAVLVDREMNHLLDSIQTGLQGDNARVLVEQTAMALFDYIEAYPDGFRILVRDAPATSGQPSFASLMVDIATQVEHLLALQFTRHKLDKRLAGMYSQMLVGMVANTGQWWLDVRKPKKDEVVANLVNLAWFGLSGMQPKPKLVTRRP